MNTKISKQLLQHFYAYKKKPLIIIPHKLNQNAVNKNGLICLFLTSKTPGPGTYEVTTPDTYRTKQPKYSLKGRKFMPGDGTIRPGPGIYYPEKVRHNFRFFIS